MKKYCLTIELLSDLCIGNGESKGNTIDNDVCTDDFGFPYIPGRRIKGILKQSFIDLLDYQFVDKDNREKNEEYIKAKLICDEIFGNGHGVAGKIQISDAKLNEIDSLTKVVNEMNSEKAYSYSKDSIKDIFITTRGQTKIDNDGIADRNSLRFTNVVNQHNLIFNDENVKFISSITIEDENEALSNWFSNCIKATRHMGTHRNRGLGNVKLVLENENEDKKNQFKKPTINIKNSKTTTITYELLLESPLTFLGLNEKITAIPSRSIIGCLARSYLLNNKVDEVFNDLFLNGKVKWSSLNPSVNNRMSYPTPLMMVYLKNNNKYYSHYLKVEENEKAKQKTLEGTYYDGKNIVVVDKQCQYHHSHGNKNEDIEPTLYMQESIKENQCFMGEVVFPTEMFDVVWELLENTHFQLGRSKSAQYSTCKLINLKVEDKKLDMETFADKEDIFFLLKSDLILQENGVVLCRDEDIREWFKKKFDLDDNAEFNDYISFHTIGGYHTMWQLQKPQISVVQGGSVFAFKTTDKTVLNSKRIFCGLNKQEGFGEIEVLTLEEVRKINIDKNKVNSYYLTEKSVFNEDTKVANRFKTALFVNNIMNELKNKARDAYIDAYIKNNKKIKHGSISRLRIMLDESNELHELIDKIKKIDSKEIKDLVSIIYDIDNEKIIFDNIDANEDEKNEIHKKYWKKPLDLILHQSYYNGGDKK